MDCVLFQMYCDLNDDAMQYDIRLKEQDMKIIDYKKLRNEHGRNNVPF